LTRNDAGKIIKEEWKVDMVTHRDDGPAIVTYFDNGVKMKVEWFLNGKLHCEDGPAFITYDDTGEVKTSEWYLNGEEQRDDISATRRTSCVKMCGCSSSTTTTTPTAIGTTIGSWRNQRNNHT
jgi:hypothetical protein